jgi:RsiW-degrading membrane proteinase PrsW (M82 family)
VWQQMQAFLKSFFIYPGLSLELTLVSVGLAIVFGTIWLTGYWPPLFKRHWLWLVATVSAFLTLLSITFVQIPLQTWAGQALNHFWNQQTLVTWLLLAGIPQILLSGLVQEGAKMVPMVFWWWRGDRNISPVSGLTTGAVAGAGFGIFEAFWVHGQVFASGWNVHLISANIFLGITPFWGRFFAVGFHIAASSLAGYGLTRGWGWQFYLIAAGLHGLLNYSTVIMQKGYFSVEQLEVYVAGLAVVVTVAALLLRWRNQDDVPVDTIDAGV